MGGGGAVLAVPGVVDHQHAPLTWGGGRVFPQQLDAALVELLVVPSRFREEPLQPLDLTVLSASDRLGAGQPGQGLVAIPREQQALQVVTEAAALGQAAKQAIKRGGVVLQRARRGWTRTAAGHRGGGLLAADTTMDRTARAYTKLNKPPLVPASVMGAASDACLQPVHNTCEGGSGFRDSRGLALARPVPGASGSHQLSTELPGPLLVFGIKLPGREALGGGR